MKLGTKGAFLVDRYHLTRERWGTFEGNDVYCWGPEDWILADTPRDFLLEEDALPKTGIHIFEFCKEGHSFSGPRHRLWRLSTPTK